MKKTTKIFLSLLWVITLIATVYATVTTASLRKSAKLPWQWNSYSYYDTAHNVWTGYLAESRFSSPITWVIYDNITKLYWQQSWTSTQQNTCKTYDTNNYIDNYCNDWTANDDCSWCAAQSYCDALVLGTYSDWRLPNIKEIISIIDFSRNNPAISTSFSSAFSSYNYWSSTPSISDISKAWILYFLNGNPGELVKYTHSYVRCVR
jgi:hypothetical protein